MGIPILIYHLPSFEEDPERTSAWSHGQVWLLSEEKR
jgi:hypothetical protein